MFSQIKVWPRFGQKIFASSSLLTYWNRRTTPSAGFLTLHSNFFLTQKSPRSLDTLVVRSIESHRAEGVTVFLVEQNANRALQIADRGYVLETGNLVLEDTGANLLSNDAVRRAYLGH